METQTDGKILLTADEAIAFLPDTPQIHSYRDAGISIIGADWDREDVLDFIKRGASIEVTGAAAQSMGHGIAVWEKAGDYRSVVYFETVKRTDAGL